MKPARIAHPKQARSTKRRHDLLLAATRVFGRYGVGGATMARIAAEADIPVSAIYDYFESKQHLLCEVPRANFEELYGRIDAPMALLPSPCARIELLFVATLDYIRANPNWGRVFFLEIWPSREAAQHDIRHAIDDYARRFLVLIDDGQREGELAADLDRHAAATILLGAMCQLVATWLLLKRPSDLVAAGGPIVRLVLCGLRRHKRKKESPVRR